jgi:hypothetical protein
MNINLRIERLILDGLPVTRGQAPLIQIAIEGELARMLNTRGLGSEVIGGIAVPSVRSSGIQLTSQNEPRSLGKQIAAAVYSGIGNFVK